MGMVVRTNMAALNANNSLQTASKAQQKGMEKLASGFKINKAADDASGLAISEKMKNQIKALDTAKDNCEDGANLIQTAEGYMAETHDMLNRMVELAEKSANGTLGDDDRDALQNEMDQLCSEIDRVATTANFNGHKLLDGSQGNRGVITLECDSAEGTVKYNAPTASGISQSQVTGTKTVTQNLLTSGGSASSAPIAQAAGSASLKTDESLKTAGIQLQIGESSTSADRLTVKIDSFHTDTLFGGLGGFINKANDKTETASTSYVKLRNNYAGDVSTGHSQSNMAASGALNGAAVTLPDGATAAIYDKDAKGSSTYASAISIDITDQECASAAADAIRQISNYVSDQRGQMGALQNRLDHTVNNLTTASENTTAANSRIRDTDMAKEMMAYTSKNVIAQAAQSMLAQANSQPQNVLSLLQ